MHVALVGAEFEENLAVRYLRGALEAAGHQVTTIVFNEPGETEAVAARLAALGAPVAGLSMVFTYRARQFARLATRARQLGYRGHVIAGGHFAAFHAEQLLRDVPAIDSVACGEGEQILCALVNNLPELHRVSGLAVRDGDQIVRTTAAIKPVDLDILPYPPRKSPFDDYLGIPITNILSSRGCSRNCAFCSIAAWHRMCGGPRLRMRSPARLADEMAWLYRQGVRVFNFHDDNFVLDDKAAMVGRIHQLRAELARRGVMDNIAFAIKCRPDVVDRELFLLLKAMGMFRVFLGVESGTQESLRQLGRGQTVSDNERALAILGELDIHTCFNLLVLNPDSTLEDFARNVEFLRKHPRNAMNFCRTEIYAGTPLERDLRRQARLLGDYWGYDYVIADPRAQTAFELLYPAFESRNYGDDGLHHLTMQIDYEQQLLRRFFGPHERLRKRVKKLIVEVNLNTCKHLEHVIATVARLQGLRDCEAYGAELHGNVQQDNAILGRKVMGLLDEIRSMPERPGRRTRPSWMRAAATAGLAATFTLAGADCKERSHPTEMAPAPSGPSMEPPPRDTAAEQPPAEPPPVGPPALIKPAVASRLLPIIAQKVAAAEPVEFELWIARDGTVSKIKWLRPQLSANAEQAITDPARAMTFADPGVRGQRFAMYFSKDEVERARPGAPSSATAPPQPTYPTERIPRPEMAPRPPHPPPRPEMAPQRPNGQ